MASACSGDWPRDSVSRSWAVAIFSSGSATRNARPFRNLTFLTTCPPRRWAPIRANVRHRRRPCRPSIVRRRPPRPPLTTTTTTTIKTAANTIRTRVPRRPPLRQFPSAAGRSNTATGRRCCLRTAADNGADVIPACRWAIRAEIRTEPRSSSTVVDANFRLAPPRDRTILLLK